MVKVMGIGEPHTCLMAIYPTHCLHRHTKSNTNIKHISYAKSDYTPEKQQYAAKTSDS